MCSLQLSEYDMAGRETKENLGTIAPLPMFDDVRFWLVATLVTRDTLTTRQLNEQKLQNPYVANVAAKNDARIMSLDHAQMRTQVGQFGSQLCPSTVLK